MLIMGNNSITNVLIVGVGGQGIILASEILASVCIASGCDVKQSEVHGMAQRGGSVVSHVRFGEKVYSPTIEKGGADYILSFEILETSRFADYLTPGGTVFVNRQRIDPITVASGTSEYPEEISSLLRQNDRKIIDVNGQDIAVNAGNIRAVNVVLLGALSKYLKFDKETWETCIRERVPEKSLDINLRAFNKGRESA